MQITLKCTIKEKEQRNNREKTENYHELNSKAVIV